MKVFAGRITVKSSYKVVVKIFHSQKNLKYYDNFSHDSSALNFVKIFSEVFWVNCIWTDTSFVDCECGL